MQSGSRRRRARHEVPTHHWARAACAGGGDGAGSADTDGRSSSRGMWGGRAEAGWRPGGGWATAPSAHPARGRKSRGDSPWRAHASASSQGGRARPCARPGRESRRVLHAHTRTRSRVPVVPQSAQNQTRGAMCGVCVCAETAVTRLVTVSRYRLWRRPAGPRFSNY